MSTCKNPFLRLTAVVAVVFFTVAAVRADMVADVSLNAQAVVNNFNSKNSGRGIYVNDYTANSGINYVLYTTKDYDYVDISGYKYPRADNYGGGQLFSTFCIEQGTQAYDGDWTGKLNYSGGQSTSANAGHAVTVGAAYLYAMYATNNPIGQITAAATLNDLGTALRILMNDVTLTDWTTTSNSFLNAMMSLHTQDYWDDIYNPDSYYSEIGNYSVFVMNMRVASSNQNSQNFLYLANAANPYAAGGGEGGGNATPEPATLLIFGMGAVGLGIVRIRRKK